MAIYSPYRPLTSSDLAEFKFLAERSTITDIKHRIVNFFNGFLQKNMYICSTCSGAIIFAHNEIKKSWTEHGHHIIPSDLVVEPVEEVVVKKPEEVVFSASDASEEIPETVTPPLPEFEQEEEKQEEKKEDQEAGDEEGDGNPFSEQILDKKVRQYKKGKTKKKSS